MNKNTFCVLPFIHLEARADGFVAPCCMSQSFYTKPSGEFFHLSKDTLSDVWESQSILELRSNLLSGVQDPKCATCWSEELVGKSSRRIRENKRWSAELSQMDVTNTKEGHIRALDLKLGNSCNLKCRICGPASSSGWIKEWEEVTGNDLLTDLSLTLSKEGSKKTIRSWPDVNLDFWDDLEQHLSSVRLFEIYGGEPFLIRKHFDLLQKSIDLGYSEYQEIHYNTNGTIYPGESINAIWRKFKRVDIMLSIDGIGLQFNYQRHPANWIDVEKNIFRFLQDFSTKDLHICLTVSSINAFYLPDYLRYFKNIGVPVWLNVLYLPDHFSMKNLPASAKEAILKSWDTIGDSASILLEPMDSMKDFLLLDSDISQEAQFIPSLKRHDAYRGESYSKIFPEFAAIIGYNESP